VSRDGVFISRRGTGEGSLPRPANVSKPPILLYCPGALPTQRVRELRSNQTAAEKAAWYLLRGRRLGAKFRRQCRIENWVVDFYCFEHRLALELDGGVHSQLSQMQRDAAKEDYLRKLGISTLRIPNGLVLEDPEGFAGKVREAIKARRG